MIARASGVLLWVALALGAPPGRLEPVISLTIPAYPSSSFANYASVLLPDEKFETIELRLTDALSTIQTSTVRVTLNGVPMTPFVSVNPTPGGVRIIVRLGMTLSPEYAISRDGESVLTLDAKDVSGTGYRGMFYLTIDPAKSRPELARTTRARAQQSATVAPPEFRAPVIRFLSEAPQRTADRVYQLEAEIADTEGLRRIVIELNGRDAEEVVLQNERPVRYKGGRIARGALAGEVTGGAAGLRLRIPLTLARDRVNVIAIRAENVRGLSARADQTIETFK